ncbi:hypothetical protein LINPERPRIM_LOCUS2881 [Linum perenne]
MILKVWIFLTTV